MPVARTCAATSFSRRSLFAVASTSKALFSFLRVALKRACNAAFSCPRAESNVGQPDQTALPSLVTT